MKIENIVGLIGWPTFHSISPQIHNAAFKTLNLDSWIYLPLPVSKFPYIRVKEAVLGLRALSFKGANVTIPYKEAVLPYLEKLSDEAKAIQAVNTIVIDSNGGLVGHNTDAGGFIKDLHDQGINIKDKEVLILGAGGSAKAIGFGLLSYGVTNLTILNRTRAKADELAIMLQSYFPNAFIRCDTLSSEGIKRAGYPSLIVNCTSIGLDQTKNEMPWDKNTPFKSDQIIYDIIYNPKKSALLTFADECGAKTINGLGMLVHQAALSFRLWTGNDAPLEEMKKVARKVL